jgi:hypothetical protein
MEQEDATTSLLNLRVVQKKRVGMTTRRQTAACVAAPNVDPLRFQHLLSGSATISKTNAGTHRMWWVAFGAEWKEALQWGIVG